MRESLVVGTRYRLEFTVGEEVTVPRVFPDSQDFAAMPQVLATAFLVALVERACVELLRPHLEGGDEQSVGTHVDLSHSAATPPGLVVTVEVELTGRQGRRLEFAAIVHDGVEEISRGTHQRFVIDRPTFDQRTAAKTATAPPAAAR